MHPTADKNAVIISNMEGRRVMGGVMLLPFIGLKSITQLCHLSVVVMQPVRLRSLALVVLTLFAQCLFCA